MMTDEKQLTAIFGALAKPVTRHFIEMVALQPHTAPELEKVFDLSSLPIQRTGSVLSALGLVAWTDREKRYDYDPRGLVVVRDWIARIESIRSGTTARTSGP